MMRRIFGLPGVLLVSIVIGLAALLEVPPASAAHDLEDFLRRDKFGSITEVMCSDYADPAGMITAVDGRGFYFLLAAGKEDVRAPPEHTEAMERALKAAGVLVESRIVPGEGHGFSNIENQRWFYGRLLSFLDQHIGSRIPANVARATDGD